MEKLSKEQEIIKLLFKDFLTDYNSRNISKLIDISHAGAFKILKKLENRSIVKSKRIGNSVIYSLNLDNPITNKEIELALLLEAHMFRRWIEEFKELDEKAKFVILFGSIIRNEKKADDIDILIVADKEKFKEIKEIIENRQKFLIKKFHPLIQDIEDFKHDITNKNKAIIETLRTGIVLFGQEELRKVMKK